MAITITVVHSYLNLRVTFSEAVDNDAALNNLDYYAITSLDKSQYVEMEILSITPEKDVDPTYVDLTLTDCTKDSSPNYNLTIVPGKIGNVGGTLDAPNNTKNFTATTEIPDLLSLESLSRYSIRVNFTKIMTQNKDLFDPSNYTFDGGLRVLKVESDSQYSVILTTTEQTPFQVYELEMGV